MKSHARIGDMVFPLPDDGLEWLLRYSEDSNPIIERRMQLASILAAYKELIYCGTKKRNHVCERLKLLLTVNI